jgi:hypothetical protein
VLSPPAQEQLDVLTPALTDPSLFLPPYFLPFKKLRKKPRMMLQRNLIATRSPNFPFLLSL